MKSKVVLAYYSANPGLAVLVADGCEEIPAAASDMLCTENRTRALRHDGAEEAPALHEEELPHVLTVKLEHVEGGELKRPTPAHEIDEDRSSVLVEFRDLAVEHRVVSVQHE